MAGLSCALPGPARPGSGYLVTDLAKVPAGRRTEVMPYCYAIYVVRFSLRWSGILAKARLGRMSRSVKDS